MAYTRKKQGNKQRSQNTMKWIVGGIVGGVVLIVAALALVSRQNDAPGQKTFDPNFQPEVTGAPAVEVLPQDVVDYGDVKLGTTINTVFKVRNVGDQPLVVFGEPQVELVQGC